MHSTDYMLTDILSIMYDFRNFISDEPNIQLQNPNLSSSVPLYLMSLFLSCCLLDPSNNQYRHEINIMDRNNCWDRDIYRLAYIIFDHFLLGLSSLRVSCIRLDSLGH